jgi:hypothetical protein
VFMSLTLSEILPWSSVRPKFLQTDSRARKSCSGGSLATRRLLRGGRETACLPLLAAILGGATMADRIGAVTIERKSAAAGEIEVGGVSGAEEDAVFCCTLAFLEYISLYLDEEGWAPYKSEVSLELDGPQEPKPEQVPYPAGQLECPPVRCLKKPTLSSPTPGQTAQRPAGPVGPANQQGEPLGSRGQGQLPELQRG